MENEVGEMLEKERLSELEIYRLKKKVLEKIREKKGYGGLCCHGGQHYRRCDKKIHKRTIRRVKERR